MALYAFDGTGNDDLDRHCRETSVLEFFRAYVGGPRNYKWINTVPITKIWEQMNLAWQYGATRIWIANVGDVGTAGGQEPWVFSPEDSLAEYAHAPRLDLVPPGGTC